MRPIFPGQFPSIKRNLFNIVLILDLSNPSSLHILGGTIANIIDRGIPFHFGLVPSIASDESRNMAKAVYWLIKNAGRKRTMEWIKKISGLEGGRLPTQLDWNEVALEFDNLVQKVREEKEDALEGVTYASGTLPEGIDAYTERLRVKDTRDGMLGHAFFNGKYFEIDHDVRPPMSYFLALTLIFLTGPLVLGRITNGNRPPSSTLPRTGSLQSSTSLFSCSCLLFRFITAYCLIQMKSIRPTGSMINQA